MNAGNNLNCGYDFNAYLFIFGMSALMLFFGSVLGYWSRHKNDRRRFNTSNFLGEIFIGVFVGLVILLLSIHYNYLLLFSTQKELLLSATLVTPIMAIGAFFSPIVVSLVENKIQDWVSNWMNKNTNGGDNATNTDHQP